MMGTVVLAHQGGWDEILLVLAPIALLGALLFIANRRAGQLADEAERSEGASEADTAGHDLPERD